MPNVKLLEMLEDELKRFPLDVIRLKFITSNCTKTE